MSLRRFVNSTSVCIAGALLAVLTAGPGHAQSSSCFQFVGTPLNTSDNCDATPTTKRSVGLRTFSWKGHSYLINNTQNNFEVYSIDNPQAPSRVTYSSFGVTLHTDTDQNLKQFSVCDDCRYGVAGFGVEGILLFDLGTGATPSFGGKEFVEYRNAGNRRIHAAF